VRSSTTALGCILVVLAVSCVPAAWAQTAGDPNAIPYEGPPTWQQAAVVALNRHLPADSGYWVLGPLDLRVDLPDTLDLVRTTLRIIAPHPRGSRGVTRRLWVPTGGVALEELQPADTLPHELPPGYPGRFLKGSIVGERTLVQVLTVQEHRWLLWAVRARVAGIREPVSGPLARYSRAVASYVAAIDSGVPTSGPPRAIEFGLDPSFDLYAQPPEPMIRDRQGYLRLLEDNRALTIEDAVRDVYAFVPGPLLVDWLEDQAAAVLYPNKDGEIALQHRYRDYESSGGRWSGYPILSAGSLPNLRPGRYVYAVDRYGVIRIGHPPDAGVEGSGATVSAALLAHGEPLRAAGELLLAAQRDGPARVSELSIRSHEYFFSNLALTLYEDVEQRSDRYILALGHVLAALEFARIPREDILIRKF
jgi:hypothetical protein